MKAMAIKISENPSMAFGRVNSFTGKRGEKPVSPMEAAKGAGGASEPESTEASTWQGYIIPFMFREISVHRQTGAVGRTAREAWTCRHRTC